MSGIAHWQGRRGGGVEGVGGIAHCLAGVEGVGGIAPERGGGVG